MKKKPKTTIAKIWHFIWEEDSLASWLVNIILAFVIVKFVIYPGLGLLLGTSYPVVAVVSGSMEHGSLDFDHWWETNKEWYLSRDITKETLQNSKFPNGFNKGDIMVLKGVEPENIKKGNTIVYSTTRHAHPIIHRVTGKTTEENQINFETKGDKNSTPDPEEITQNQLIGKAVLKIPLLGWIKIIFTQITGGIT